MKTMHQVLLFAGLLCKKPCESGIQKPLALSSRFHFRSAKGHKLNNPVAEDDALPLFSGQGTRKCNRISITHSYGQALRRAFIVDIEVVAGEQSLSVLRYPQCLPNKVGSTSFEFRILLGLRVRILIKSDHPVARAAGT